MKHNCIVGSSTLWHFSEGEQERLFQPNSHWRCNSGGAVLAAIEGMGICQLPHFYVKDALLRGQLIPVLERNTPPAEPIWAVYPDRRHLSPKVRGFVHLLRSELQAALET